MPSATSARPTLAVGIDIVAIERVARIVTRYSERLLGRVYTPAEWHACRNCVADLASLFAAKEAAAKALGTGLAYLAAGGVELYELEITGVASGRPCLSLYGSAEAQAQALGWKEWAVSLAVSRMHAIAFVVAVS